MATRIQIRRDTEASWSSNNPVLASGELALSTDVAKIKIGDSSTDWSSLGYSTIGQGAVQALIDTAISNLVGGAPDLLDTLNELAAAIGDDEDFFTNIYAAIEAGDSFDPAPMAFSSTKPSAGPRQTEDTYDTLEDGDTWYDSHSGRLYVYSKNDSDQDVWAEVGGSDVVAKGIENEPVHQFPENPSDLDTHKGYVYDSTKGAWNIDRTKNIDDIDNVDTDSNQLANDQVLMYNSSTEKWENIAGIKLDSSGYVPESYLTPTLDSIDTDISNINTALEDFATMTVQTEAAWASDSSIPDLGSLNVSTGSGVRIKIGDGINTFANLEYLPDNTYLAAEVAAAIAPLSPKANPTFSGTVSLPSTTSIGDVSDAEIAHLDGVTSGIQGQIDDLDTLKAPIANPTFTGTVSGIDKTMVGLSNVDSTADTDKPVSTAQQTALDTKLNLAGGTMTGKITLDGDPTQALHAVTKQYVDSVEAGLLTRPSVVVATTTNLSGTYDNGTSGVGATLNLGPLAELNIDGVTDWSQYEGILVKDQTNKAENGRYVVLQVGQSGYDLEDIDWILRRCSLCDEADEIPGSYIFVTDGATNDQTGWVQHVDDTSTFVVGTDDIDVYQFAGAGAVTAGTNVSVSGTQISVVDSPVFAGTVDASAAGVAFSDGTQTQAGVPSLTTFVEKTADYQLDTLDHKDNVIEMNMSTPGTFTVPLDATLAWPVGASMDIFATGTGEITIAGEAGVTLNATPGLILRTQWSSATIMKRAANSWVVYGDLKA